MKRLRVSFFIVLGFVVMLLCGCRETPLDLAVRYASLGDLRPDNSVYLEYTRIGHIERIVSSDKDDYLVKIEIDPDYKNEITEYTHFLLSTDPLNREEAAIVIERSRTGGKLLESGSIVKGERRGLVGEILSRLQQSGSTASNELQMRFDKMKQAFVQGVNEISAGLDEAVSEIGRSLNELQESWRFGTAQRELDKLQSNIDQFIAEFQKSGAEVQKKMRQEIIPEIRKHLEELEKKMRQEHRDSEADQVEKRLNELIQV